MNPHSQSLTAEVLEKEDSNLLSHPECNIPPKKKEPLNRCLSTVENHGLEENDTTLKMAELLQFWVRTCCHCKETY